MLAFLSNVASNIVANLVVALLLGAIAVAYVRRSRRKGVRELFGFEPGRGEMRIVVSSVAASSGSSSGIAQGFRGDAISEIEYRHALTLTLAIERRPGSGLVSTLLGTRADVDPIRARIEQSGSVAASIDAHARGAPRAFEEIEASLRASPCTVIIGGPTYNLLAFYLSRERSNRGPGSSCFEFVREEGPDGPRQGIRSHFAEMPQDYWRSEEPDGVVEDFFVLEKITIAASTIFLCAGTCTTATAAAVDKLSGWHRLAKEYGPQDFGRLYSWNSAADRYTAVERRESAPSTGWSKCLLEYRRNRRSASTGPRTS